MLWRPSGSVLRIYSGIMVCVIPGDRQGDSVHVPLLQGSYDRARLHTGVENSVQSSHLLSNSEGEQDPRASNDTWFITQYYTQRGATEHQARIAGGLHRRDAGGHGTRK